MKFFALMVYGGLPFKIEMMNDILLQDTPRIGYWIDSSELTPKQTVEGILNYCQQKSPINY